VPKGDVNEPPGVLASSVVDARIDEKLPYFPDPEPVLALARRVPDSCTVLGLVLLPRRRVPRDNGDFFGDGGCGSVGVAGVMTVDGVPE